MLDMVSLLIVMSSHVERSLVDSRGRPMILFNTSMSPFSNFYNSPFEVHGQLYRTSEQYYQYWKAAYFGDMNRALAIRNEPRPGKCKNLARSIRNFDQRAWHLVAPVIMKQAVVAKFRGNAVIRKKLLKSGDAILVDASPFDPFWGSGLDIFDDAHTEPEKWRGFNVLGNILMDVREMLRNDDV